MFHSGKALKVLLKGVIKGVFPVLGLDFIATELVRNIIMQSLLIFVDNDGQ